MSAPHHPDPHPDNTTDSPSWRTITNIRDVATREGGGIPMDDRCHPNVIQYRQPEFKIDMDAFTQGCGSEGTMVLVPFAPDPADSKTRAGFVRACVECDAVAQWPRYAAGTV